MAWRDALLVSAALTLASPAGAVTYCCTDEGGRRVCGDILPVQCQNRAYQEFNAQGVPTRQHEAPMTAEQRTQREAERARRKADEQKADDERRRDRALMASYTSTADIDAKRDRMIEDAGTSLKLAQERRDAALARQKTLNQEAEFYQKKPIPESLKSGMLDNEREIAAQQAVIAERTRDIETIRARFDEEKRRYLSLGGRLAAPAAKAKAAPAPARN